MKIQFWSIVLLGLMTLGGLGSNHWIDFTGSRPAVALSGPPPRVAGFSLLGEETFRCGGVAHTVPVYVHTMSGLEFVLVPGGTFTMGSVWNERGRGDDESRRRDVAVEPFLLCRTECTREAWLRIKRGGVDCALEPDLPVKGVSWDDCSAWCRLAGLRLPTEREWEYACRAGTATRYCFGDRDDDLPEYAWCGRNSQNRAHPVGRLKANAFGLFDMHGNVWELCHDVLEAGQNPASAKGLYRAKRGGCYRSAKDPYLRSANRSRSMQDCCYEYLGFRPACSL